MFELAKVMGTSVRMIEKHYGALLDGAHAGLVGRLDANEASSSRPTRSEAVPMRRSPAPVLASDARRNADIVVPGQPERPEMASPISFAPMRRKSTAMITAL